MTKRKKIDIENFTVVIYRTTHKSIKRIWKTISIKTEAYRVASRPDTFFSAQTS